MKLRAKPVVQGLAAAFGGLMIVSADAQQPQVQEEVTVTGSRILKRDFISTSPIVTITAEELTAHQDVTLETFLNTLPQVNPAATTTSNNPGNGGQANIDLRGLGSNRNLVLIDGRRAMVSASDQTVDLNTIPVSMIESIEVITGGAAAVYGADAVAGVVNVKLKRRVEGFELRGGWQDSTKGDSQERNISMLWGGNFAGGRGNAVLAFEYADREQMIKSQRDFAAVATATTSYFPEGTYRPTSNNAPSQSVIDSLYGQPSYGGAPAGTVPRTAAHSFNSDGSLIYPGIFNSPRDVLNWRYPVDSGVNTKLFPDVYSYNFDAVNILVLPFERRSAMAKADYKFKNDVEVFGQFLNTKYDSTSALAPTPVPTVTVASPSSATTTQASSPLVTPGSNVGAQLVVPVTNPFIPTDLKTLLDSRTGDNPALVGSGANEPFLMRWRTVAAGLRTQTFQNDVTQYVAGAKGPLFGTDWNWQANLSEGRTKITNAQGGNIDTNRLLRALEAPDGGASLCEGGVNPFGRQPLSASCVKYLTVATSQTTEFVQQVGTAFVSGELLQLPSGALAAVFGGEFRNFDYDFKPGAASGPISGFNAQSPSAGRTTFRDFFAEVSAPILRNAQWAQELDFNLGYRYSKNESKDEITGVEAPAENSNAWSINLNWQPVRDLRVRGSIQESVRAPNFGELFDGTGSAPQIYDPCSVTSVARTSGANAAQLSALCASAGAFGGLGGAVSTHVQTPGTQASITYEGNRDLKPEKGTSYTLGLVWQPQATGLLSGLRLSVDYYRIKVKDAITLTDSNEYIADCYNFYGNNSSYDPNNSSCQSLVRFGDIIGIEDPNDPNGAFRATNGGKIETDGIDVQANWGMAAGPGRLDLLFNLNYLISYKAQTAPGLPFNEFAGTIPYFGAGIGPGFGGQAFPEWRFTLGGRYKWSDFSVDARMRYIGSMENRMGVLFPGEQFTGVPSTTYWDFGATWEFARNMLIRAGLNNAFDQKPRTYAPNVQSGTDPSTYDVVGRRWFLQAQLKFE